MTTYDDRLLSLAEDLNTFLPLAVGDERFETSEYVQWLSSTADPHHNVVQRLRIPANKLSQAVDRTREVFAARGRHQSTWEVGQRATPKDLADLLVGYGMKPDDPEPVAIGMVHNEGLPSFNSDLVVKRIETLDEYIACCEVVSACFGAPPVEDAQEQFDILQAEGRKTRWIALLNDNPVAMADAIHLDFATVLSGGATLPEARGRGAYKALLAARSLEAQKRGVPSLVTQASSMSRPILRHLGFKEVSEVRIFVDSF